MALDLARGKHTEMRGELYDVSDARLRDRKFMIVMRMAFGVPIGTI